MTNGEDGTFFPERKENYFTPGRMLKILGICLSVLAGFWLLFPESSLPVWSSHRGIVEEFFYHKANYFPSDRNLYGRGPGLSALTASLLAASLVCLIIVVLNMLSRLLAEAVHDQEGQKIRAACRMIEMILVLALIGVALYFFGVPVRVTGFAAVLLILAVELVNV